MGVGILLVVVGHAWRGLQAAGLMPDGPQFRGVDTFIYNFHMPLFFLLSGLKFEAWALRQPIHQAAASRVIRLLWPLALWTYVFAAFKLAAGDLVNTPVSGAESLLVMPLPPQNHLWFLWALFLIQICALAVIRISGSGLPAAAWLALALALPALDSLGLVQFNTLTTHAATYASAFLTGLGLAHLRWQPTRPAPVFGLAAVAFIGFQTLGFGLPATPAADQLLGVATALAALMMISAAVPATTGLLLQGLVTLGACSMGIFLAHTIFSAAVRILLQPHVTDVGLHMLAGTLAGLAGPLLVYAMIRKLGDPRWIGF